jgi:RNA polymerase sigma-70 factor (ECF subfamily)
VVPFPVAAVVPEANVDKELEVRRLCEEKQFDLATTEALRTYGREVFGFLCAFHKNEADASEVFSVFSEDLWRSLSTFAWECSLRTWAYTLARRASFRAKRRKHRDQLLGSDAPFSKIVHEVRTETLAYLRTETKSRLRALRDTLPEQDQALLVLRVDRGLAWDELARVLSEEDGVDEGAEGRKKEAARLRKRFQIVKDKLKELAKREGLYPSSDDGS